MMVGQMLPLGNVRRDATAIAADVRDALARGGDPRATAA